MDIQPWNTAQFGLARLFFILKWPYPRFPQSLHMQHSAGVRQSGVRIPVAEMCEEVQQR